MLKLLMMFSALFRLVSFFPDDLSLEAVLSFSIVMLLSVCHHEDDAGPKLGFYT